MTVWEERDLPVLRAIAEPRDEQFAMFGFLTLGHDIARQTLGVDLDDAEIHDAILTLGEAGYLVWHRYQLEMGPGAHVSDLRVTGAGSQALGEWPLFHQIASPQTLALFLEQLAEEADTEEEADSLRRAGRYFRGMSAEALRALATGATAQLARALLGFG